MDGENNEKPYEQMDDLGGNTPIFGNTHILMDLNCLLNGSLPYLQPSLFQHFFMCRCRVGFFFRTVGTCNETTCLPVRMLKTLRIPKIPIYHSNVVFVMPSNSSRLPHLKDSPKFSFKSTPKSAFCGGSRPCGICLWKHRQLRSYSNSRESRFLPRLQRGRKNPG